MKQSIKATLLSAFVFPGLGHVFLRKYIPGIVLVSASFAAIYYLISKTVERALELAEKIQSGDVPLDVEAITELASKQSAGTDDQLLNIATAALVICWLFGIIDSYRVGRVRDKKND